jgi:hypothetical protein
MMTFNLKIIKYFFTPIILLLTSCIVLKTSTLLDNSTQVPKNIEVYKNQDKFNLSILSEIDTSFIYEEYNIREHTLERLLTGNNNHNRYIFYKFYSNGCFNVFSYWKDSTLPVSFLNPNYSGLRGIYYLTNGKIFYDEFGGVDQFHNIGKITGTFRTSGDTLFEKRNDIKGLYSEKFTTNIYIKRKLPKEYFQYKANW